MTALCELIKNVFEHDTYYIFAESIENNVIGVLPLVQLKSRLFGNYMVSMPYFNYGRAVADTINIEASLMKQAVTLASELSAGHIEFRDTNVREPTWPVRKDKVNMILELPYSDELLGKAIGSKKRSQIRCPLKEGVKNFIGGIELLEEFYHVFSINMRDLGTPVYSKVFFLEILRTFPKQTKIMILRLKGKHYQCGFFNWI